MEEWKRDLMEGSSSLERSDVTNERENENGDEEDERNSVHGFRHQ